MSKGTERLRGHETPEPFPFKAIIYDLDGLLVDSEELWFETFASVLSRYGITLEEEQRVFLLGRGNMSSFLIERFGIKEEPSVLRQKIWETFSEQAEKGLKPLPGAVDSVKRLSPYLRLAVASSAHTDYVEMAVLQLGIRDFFQVLVGGDQVARAKPQPEVFLRASELLEVRPEQCLVLEDSLSGVEAAKAANMFCIAVPNRFLVNSDFSRADLLIPTLEHLDFSTLQKLAESKKPL